MHNSVGKANCIMVKVKAMDIHVARKSPPPPSDPKSRMEKWCDFILYTASSLTLGNGSFDFPFNSVHDCGLWTTEKQLQ